METNIANIIVILYASIGIIVCETEGGLRKEIIIT